MRFKFVKKGNGVYPDYHLNIGDTINDYKKQDEYCFYHYNIEWVSPRDPDFRKEWGTFIPCDFITYYEQLNGK
jgi:hypothetical protein